MIRFALFRRLIPTSLAAALVAAGATGADRLGSRANAQLTLLHLADVYSMSPVSGGSAGGLARVASLKKSLEAEGRTVVLTWAATFCLLPSPRPFSRANR